MVGLVARERAEYLGHIAWSADGAYCLEHIILNIYCLEHIHEQVLPAALLAHPSADTRAAPPWPASHITTHTQLLSQGNRADGEQACTGHGDKSGLELDGCHIRASLCTATLKATAAASSRTRRAAPDVAVTLDSSRSAVADSHELVPETYRLVAVRPKAHFED